MHPASSPAVVIRDVGKSYMREERRLQVLTDCSFTIEANQLTVLLGPSGSGKTTLVRLIAGYERADTGEISATASRSPAPVPNAWWSFRKRPCSRG